MVSQGPSPRRSRFPTGSVPGKYRATAASVTMATFSVPARSAGVNPRPRRIGMRMVSKYAGVVARKSTTGGFARPGFRLLVPFVRECRAHRKYAISVVALWSIEEPVCGDAAQRGYNEEW